MQEKKPTRARTKPGALSSKHSGFGLDRIGTGILVSVAGLGGIVVFAIWESVYPAPYSGTPSDELVASLMFFFWGLAGLVIMIRKEIPGLPNVRGWLAILQGGIVLAVCWGFALVGTIKALTTLLLH